MEIGSWLMFVAACNMKKELRADMVAKSGACDRSIYVGKRDFTGDSAHSWKQLENSRDLKPFTTVQRFADSWCICVATFCFTKA